MLKNRYCQRAPQFWRGNICILSLFNEVNNKFPPQELNTKYKGKSDEAAAAVFMDDFVRLLRADPATKHLSVVSFTAIFTDYRLAKPHTAFDFGNIHSYQGNGVPSSSLEMNITSTAFPGSLRATMSAK